MTFHFRFPHCIAATVAALLSTLHAAPIPLNLPRPDGKPGDPSKPMKVYILAGQSNMVGMGDITGAQPQYPAVYLSADPAIIPGELPVGTSRSRGACRWEWRGIPFVGTHGIHQSADASSQAGATLAIHKGAYDPKTDYSKLVPEKTTTFPLGTLNVEIPRMDEPCTPVASAFISVPESGNYLVHVGSGDSTHALALVDGKEVYRKEPGGKPVLTKVPLEAGKRHPLQVTWFKGGSAALWLEQVDLIGKGDLVTLTKKDGKFPHLIDDAGNWTVRNDVWFQEARLVEGGKSAPMSAESNKKCLPKCNSIGPEVGFGFVMGEFHDEQVLLIKTSMGNRSLKLDFRPPSSGRTEPTNDYEGYEYRAMVKGVRETLANIDKVVPGYHGQGYELAGFGWFQGHKDSGSTKEEYEKCLVDLINDLRKEFKAPNMKAVVATVGFHGYRLVSGPWKGVWEAQMAVGDPKQHPAFAGTVASVDTRDYWREVEESPRSQDYHYHRNPETYLLVGEAMGRAMVRLLGGQAEDIPKSDREARTMAAVAAEAAKPVSTPEMIAASNAAVKPMILDGLLARLTADPRTQPVLQSLLKPAQPKPAKLPEYLDDAIDDAVAYYQAAGISDYDWKPVIADMKTAAWDHHGFDLPNSPYKLKPTVAPAKPPVPAPFEVTPPAGMENWFAPDFDAAKAGWKKAPAPFGMKLEEALPEDLAWVHKYPLYPVKRPQPATVTTHEVLLMRGTFDVPPPKEGHRYRIRLEGSINNNSGEGYAIYLNGKPLFEMKNGVLGFRRQGLRGSHIWQENLDALKTGKLTLAVANFPMSNYNPNDFIPAIGPLSVWLEEQKLPPVAP
jgi:hypothetical protein